MEEAAVVRRAARETVGDIEPPALRDDLRSVIESGSMAPGVFTLLTARAHATGDDVGIDDRSVGVQLIYEGLRLTRRLGHEEPWEHGEKARGDMDILAADVLVSRGFYLLARTEAAAAAVEVVRSFGRDQTTREQTGDRSLDANLERDVFELAAIAGATAGGRDPSAELLGLATELTADLETAFPADDVLFSEVVRDRIRRTVGSPYADL